SIKNFPKLNRNVSFKNMLFDINPKDVNVLKEEYNNNFRLHQLYDLFEDKSVCDLKFGLYLKLDQESKDYISKFDTLLSRGDLVAIIFSNFLLSLSDMQYDLLFDVFRFLKEDEQYVNMLKK